MAKATAIEKPPGLTIGSIIKSPDVQFALSLVAVIFTMIMPLPPLILDMLLSMSVTLGFLILLVAIYVKEPLDFSTFPIVLLISTLFRLGLNVATTRSILLDAPTGDVSSIVKPFGNFVVGGNYFVGFVIFVILVVINFIVITKGAGRVAEVGARFTLDAMPGKQMAIDAELNAGLIKQDEAKKRRQQIEKEADFYGAMDGASKFVRGDAIAGIIITAINIIMGLILGVTTYNMSFQESAEIFTLLTVGDGLVTQIPALIISTAAGIVVTRSGASSNADDLSESLFRQLVKYPKALFVCSVLLFSLAAMPGMPTVPFIILGIGIGLLGRYSARLIQEQFEKDVAEEEAEVKEGGVESIENLLHIDTIAIEVGVGLIPLVDTQQDGEVLERIVSSRKQFAKDLGIIVPMVMVRDNIQLRPGEYQILLKGNVVGSGSLMVDYLLGMDPGDISEPIDGIKGVEPAYGLDAVWIKPSQKEEASFRGYTVVNCATIIVTHLTKVIEEHASELIGRQEVQNLSDTLKAECPKVVEEVLGQDLLTIGDVVKVLQNLLNERVSIRDLLTIYETLADYCKVTKNPDALTRFVRIALGRGIIKKYLDGENTLNIIHLDRAVEDLVASGLAHREDGSTTLQLDPEVVENILRATIAKVEEIQQVGALPIVLCSALIRWELKELLNRFVPGIIVLAADEVPPGTSVNSLGIITMT